MLYALLQVYFTISDLEIMPGALDKSSKHARGRISGSSREKTLVNSLKEGSPIDFWAVPQSDREVCHFSHTCCLTMSHELLHLHVTALPL
jgi:hypothetical protein